MQDDSLQLRVTNVTSINDIGNSNMTLLKLSLAFKNIGQSPIRIDPSYLFIQDKELYVYGQHESTVGSLLSPLRMSDLESGEGVSGDIIIAVPGNSSNLVFMYLSPNNSFVAVIP